MNLRLKAKKISVRITSLLLAAWLVVVVSFTACTLSITGKGLHPAYSVMKEASLLAERAMSAVKEYRLTNGKGISPYDKLQTGMIGDGEQSVITTTDGHLDAKRTSCDPNWAAVIVGMFKKARLVANDEIVMVFSGSFPAMNICALAAAQAYGLKQCVMSSVGASYYGATDPDFTFFDMAEYLCNEGILTHRIDYVSFGGNNDIGDDFQDEIEFSDGTRTAEEVRVRIRTAVENSETATFIYERDFVKNIDLRLEYIREKTPDVKFLLNVGGSLIGLGKGVEAYLDSGYSSPSRFGFLRSDPQGKRNENYGLLQYFHSVGVPVASMLNLKGLAATYGIPFDPDEKSIAGEGETYYVKQYSSVFPVIALVFSAAAGVAYYVFKKREKPQADDRNYVLRRRFL